MGIIHTSIAFKKGGLKGIQASQRDWSQYIVHFTSAEAMNSIKQYPCRKKYSPMTLSKKLDAADKKSFRIVKKIKKTMSLIPSKSNEEDDSIEACVCFSECNLPGLINHCERYGRFGFVFKKETIFALGGRPTFYLDRNMYTKLAIEYKKTRSPESKRFLSLANILSPPGFGEIQDFTHEREWRLFSELSLNDNRPNAVLCPMKYYDDVLSLFKTTVIPIDLLDEWGL